MTCDHRLSGGPLVCDREAEHDAPKGCTYSSTSGVPGFPEPRDDE